MAIHVQNFHVDAFRGIHAFEANNMNHINLIVGDNNCGKTSILEALLLLRNPPDIANILRVSRQRESTYSFSRISIFDCFMSMLPQGDTDQRICIHAECFGLPVDYVIQGEPTRIMLDESDVRLFPYSRLKKDIPPEANAFLGSLEWRIGDHSDFEKISIHEHSRISGIEFKRGQLMDMTYLSPVDHVRTGVLNNIVRNEGYKEICLRVIKMFDPEITDLLILKNELTNRPVEYIKHQKLGTMPVSTYGDGIKKVLLFANAIASSAGGVLLIDEIDTAIHSKYYDDIFRFLIKACRQYNVQLFITTHNIEAVDALLATQDYQEQSHADEINVITLKKEPQRTFTRILSGREVFNNREAFNFEVRL